MSTITRSQSGTAGVPATGGTFTGPVFFKGGPHYDVGAPTGVSAVDTANMNAAINAAITAGRGVIRLAPGDYARTTVLPALTAGVALVGAGSERTRILAPSWAGGMVSAAGSVAAISSPLNLTADTSPGATSLTVTSTTGLAAGDLILLGDIATPDTTAATRYNGELLRVSAIPNSTTINLTAVVRDQYTTARTASVQKVTTFAGARVAGLTVVNTAPSTNSGFGLSLSWCEDFVVEDVGFVAIDGPGINLVGTYGGNIDSLRTADLVDDNVRFGYGINISGPCDGLVVRDGLFLRGRHGVTTNGVDNLRGMPHDCLISRGVSRDSVHSGFDTHSHGAGITFQDCHVFGAQAPMYQIRSRDVRLIGCTGSYGTDVAVEFAASAPNHGAIIKGCTFKHVSSHAIRVGGVANDMEISGNTFDDIGSAALTVTAAALRGRFVGNTVAHVGRVSQSQGVQLSGGSDGWRIERNTFVGGASSEVGVGGTTRCAVNLLTTTNAHIADNTGSGFTQSTFVEGATANHVLRNNRIVTADPTLSITYDSTTGQPTQVIEDSVTTTFTYNLDGTIATSKRGAAATQTYSYSNGNLTGVA